VIIPTYNERENIQSNIDRCSRALEAAGCEYEIIVVDDDSPDRTWALVEEAYADDNHVRVFRRTEDRGLALSIVEGFHLASMDYCVVIDGDLQHPPEKIPELLAALDSGADIAIGSRHVEGGGMENWSRFRQIISKGATAIARRCLPSARGLSDPMSGLFAVRRPVVEGVELQPQGYKILLEILSKCDLDQIVEVGYIFRDRTAGESKLTAGQYQQFAEHVLGLSIGEYAKLIGENPRRVIQFIEFMGVGAVGVLVNTIVFYLAVTASVHYLIAGSVAFLVAVQWNFAGNWLVTFDRPRDALRRRYVAFHAVCVVGLVIYELVLLLATSIPRMPLIGANLAAIGVTSLWNFIGAENTAFGDKSRLSADVVTDKRETEVNVEHND
jgi:dolichol-phosphate mannosyltransferase